MISMTPSQVAWPNEPAVWTVPDYLMVGGWRLPGRSLSYNAPMDLNLNGKRALVCGSSQGIGLAAAQALSELGAAVTLVARDKSKLEAAAGTLAATAGQSHATLAADFREPQALQDSVARLVQDQGTFHILVNNTGGPPPGPAHTASTQAYLDGFQAHVICNQLLVQALLPGMRESGYGRIVNIISTSVREPIAGLGVSNTIRGAVASWAKTLATELGPDGITVNNVLPGFTDTTRLAELIRSRAETAGVDDAEIAAGMRAQVPLGRFAKPQELGDAIAFLCTPAAAYISGVSLAVDGGRTRCI
jgi:3-oxoacyl-[acyl-carrier protein] reductase